MGNNEFQKLLQRPRISLDALREEVHVAQTDAGDGGKAVAKQQIRVNRDGQIVMGAAGATEERQLSTVPLEVFASIASDQKLVEQ